MAIAFVDLKSGAHALEVENQDLVIHQLFVPQVVGTEVEDNNISHSVGLGFYSEESIDNLINALRVVKYNLRKSND